MMSWVGFAYNWNFLQSATRYICRNQPEPYQNLFYSHFIKFYASSNTLWENANKSNSTHNPSQLINVTDIWHKWADPAE